MVEGVVEVSIGGNVISVLDYGYAESDDECDHRITSYNVCYTKLLRGCLQYGFPCFNFHRKTIYSNTYIFTHFVVFTGLLINHLFSEVFNDR